MAYPGALPTFTGFTSSHTLAADLHAAQHNLEQSEVVAIATKVGTGASTASNNTVLRGNGIGTSVWGQANLTTDITGVLPVANGGTGQTNLSGLAFPNPTITGTVAGGATYSTPVLSVPTISDFTNATHTHANVVNGGQIANAGISGVGTEKLNNPYKFSVYQNGAANTGSAVFAVVPFDTEKFDTSNNIVAGVFTVPLTGYYQFNWMIQVVATGIAEQLVASLFVNGVRTVDGADPKSYGTTVDIASGGGGLLSLTAGQTVDIRAFDSAGARAINVGNIYVNSFSGFLVSAT